MERLRDWLISARFFWLGATYVVAVMVVWLFAWPDQPPSRDYVAAVRMATNHRVVASELRRPASIAGTLGFYIKTTASIEGKYVKPKAGILPGQPVNDAVLSDSPDMTLPNKTTAVVFPLTNSKVTRLLDAGSPVVLFGQDPNSKAAVSIPATVHAILCDPVGSETRTCYPILCIAENQAKFVLNYLAALKLVPTSVHPSPQP